MKVLHVTPYFAPSWAYGGPPRSVYELCRELVRLGHDVTVLTTDAGDADHRAHPPSETLEGIEVRRLPNLSNGLAYRRQLFLPRGMRRFLRNRIRHFDLVHLHMYRTAQDVSVHRVATRSGVPYVFAARGSLPRIVRGLVAKAAFDAFIGNRVLRDASFCIASSKPERGQYEAFGVPASRIRTILNGLDSKSYRDLPNRGTFARRYGLEGKRLVTYLGRLNERKGLESLLHAFRPIATVNENAVLVLVGPDDGYRHRIENLAGHLGLSEKTVLTGLLTGKDRLAAFVDASVVVYPAQHEVFGLVPFEALACGRPVVVADDSGCGEIISEARAGYVVPVGDVSRLSEAISTAIENRAETAEMIERGRRFVMERLAWDVIGEETVATYRDALSKRPEVVELAT